MDAAEMLKRGFTRETAIRRDRKSRWFDGDEAITHPRLIEKLDAWIDRAPDGRFCLSNEINWAFVEIEGPPYFVRSVRLGDEITLHLSGGREELLDPATLRLDGCDALWCDVREGRVPARFDRNAVHQLADVMDEDEEGPFFRIKASKVRPPVMADPMSTWTPARGHVS